VIDVATIWSTAAEIHSTSLALGVLAAVVVLWRLGRRREVLLVLAVAVIVSLLAGPTRDIAAEPQYFLVPLAVGVSGLWIAKLWHRRAADQPNSDHT